MLPVTLWSYALLAAFSQGEIQKRLARRCAAVWLVAQDRLNHVHSTNPSTLFLMTAVSKICTGITPPASRHLRCSTQPQQHVMDTLIFFYSSLSSLSILVQSQRWSVQKSTWLSHAFFGLLQSFRFTVACGCLDTAACQLVAWHQKMWPAYLSCVCMCEICTLFTPLFDVTCLQTRAKNVKFHFRLKNAAPSKRNGAWRSKLRRRPRTPNDSIFQKLPPPTWSVELGSSHGSRHNCRRSPIDLWSITTRSEVQIQDRYLMRIPQRFLAHDAWTLHDESKMNPRWVAHRHLLPSDAVGAARWLESKPKLNLRSISIHYCKLWHPNNTNFSSLTASTFLLPLCTPSTAHPCPACTSIKGPTSKIVARTLNVFGACRCDAMFRPLHISTQW